MRRLQPRPLLRTAAFMLLLAGTSFHAEIYTVRCYFVCQTTKKLCQQRLCLRREENVSKEAVETGLRQVL